MVSISLSARDFTYTYEGQTLTYTVLDEDAKTCATKAGTKAGLDVNFKYEGNPGNLVKGNLILPTNPKAGDVKFTLTEIGDFALVVAIV